MKALDWSQTKLFFSLDMTKQKKELEWNNDFVTGVKTIIKYKDRIPEEFWKTVAKGTKNIIWVWDVRTDDYEWTSERIGITKDGEVIYGFDSGCSCNSEWEKDNAETDTAKCGYHIKTWKAFEMSMEDLEKFGQSNPKQKDWQNGAFDNLKDYLLLTEEDPEPEKVFAAKNAEVRRYLMKRVGYDNIKKHFGKEMKVIHKDGESELFDIKIGGRDERYIKVKDASTPREYILSVPAGSWGPQKCHDAVAWTFGLRGNEYHPEKET